MRGGDKREEHNLVFHPDVGKELDPSHVRRAFRSAIAMAEGVTAADWTPRELRHSFVSLLSDNGGAARKRSPGWSATPVRPSRRRSTGSRSAP